MIEKGAVCCVRRYLLGRKIELGNFDCWCGCAACGVGAGGRFGYVQEPFGRTLG